MTIDEIYRLVQTFANKEQRGFITPSEFNLLAKQAELELYNKRLSVIKEKSPNKKNVGVYGESLAPEIAKQDIAPFYRVQKVGIVNDSLSYKGASGNIDTHYIETIFCLPDEENDISTNIPVDIVEPKDVNQILRSSLVKPSIEFPIALIGQGNGSVVSISVFPESITNIIVYHYYNNNSPKWNYITVAGKPVYDAFNSNDFKISERTHGELVVKILEYLGVTIREPEIVQYAQASELKADS
tara:strand:- start:146 stop:871 length:726 start_codon:yes stop_codon:yes gene_type:complete